jgi:hypothetical protein
MQEVKAGTELMEITDYLGNILEVVVAPYDGFMVLIHGTPSLCVGKTQVGSIGRLLKKIPVT